MGKATPVITTINIPGSINSEAIPPSGASLRASHKTGGAADHGVKKVEESANEKHNYRAKHLLTPIRVVVRNALPRCDTGRSLAHLVRNL